MFFVQRIYVPQNTFFWVFSIFCVKRMEKEKFFDRKFSERNKRIFLKFFFIENIFVTILIRDIFYSFVSWKQKKANNIPFNIIRIDESHKPIRKCNRERHHSCKFTIIWLCCTYVQNTRQVFSMLYWKFKQISCYACCIYFEEKKKIENEIIDLAWWFKCFNIPEWLCGSSLLMSSSNPKNDVI